MVLFLSKKISHESKNEEYGTDTGIENTTVPNTDNYDSISEQDMIVESPVGFFLTWNMMTKVFQIFFQKVPSKLMI